MVAWAFGPREEALAGQVVALTRGRTAQGAGVPWVSDGWKPYRKVIPLVYREAVRTGRRGRPPLQPVPGVGLTQAVKRRRRGRVVGVEVRPVIGEPVACPYPVHSERLNGVLRDRLACLTRKTHAFAKEPGMWDGAVVLALFEANWIRPHPALRVWAPDRVMGRRYQRRTPAMVAGLTDHPWSLVEMLTHSIYPQ